MVYKYFIPSLEFLACTQSKIWSQACKNIGGIKYIIASFDCTPEELTPEDKFRYFDDLYMIEFIILTEKLKEYDFTSHIPSDILVNKPFLPTESVKMQSYLDKVSQWTEENKMLLNENK